jgi:hypothetical protein
MAQEGAIVRNKVTGAMGRVVNGQVVPIDAAPQAPIIAPPDPYKQASEQRAQSGEVRADEDQSMQRRQLEISEQNAARTAAEAERGSVEQGKTAGFLRRAIQAERDFGALGGVEPRSLPGQMFKDNFPNAANYVSDADRQLADQSERAFIAAILRYDSGAAIPDNEYVTQGQIYFPRPGDSAEVLKQKDRARRTAISGLLQSAGRAGDAVWNETGGIETLPETPETDDESGLTGGVTDDRPLEGPQVTDENLGPDGQPRVTGDDPGYMQIAAGIGDVVQGGLNNTVGLLANPVNTNLFRAFGYDGYTSDIGQTAREGLGLPYGNETIGAINQAASGGLSGAGMATSISRNLAPGLARNALLEYGSRPMLDMATGGSAAASGEAVRQMGGGPVAQTLATVAGGAAPTAAISGRNALMNFGGGRPPTDFDPAVVAAGERQGIPIRRPDAAPSQRGAMANAAQTQHGGPMISAARNADQEAVEARVQAIGGEGAPSDPFTLGTRVQAAGTRFIARTRAQATRLYERADEASGGARVTPKGAIETADRHIADLEAQGASTNSDLLTYLRGLRGDLSKEGGFSITEFQGLRSNSNKKIKGDQALTATDADRRLTEIAQAFTADASEQLPEAATSALQGADQFYTERQDFIKGVLRNVMGTRGQPLPAERAAERLVAMTKGKGDQERFSRMWAELEPEDQADLAATIAASLGRKANGDFSLSTLIRSLDPRTGVNPRTARLVFGDEGAQALTDLRTIASAKTGTQQGMNNSNTGATVTRAAGGLKTLMLGALGYSAGGPVGAVAGGLSRDLVSRIGEQRTARLLLNPDFTKWLKAAPDTTNPQAINAYFGRLSQSAAKSPIYAGDVKALQEALAETFAKSPGRLAAAEQEDN